MNARRQLLTVQLQSEPALRAWHNRDDEAVMVARDARLGLEFLLVLQAELLVARSHGLGLRRAAVEVALGRF